MKKKSHHYFRPDHYLKYPIVLKSAEGTTIKDVNGKEYIDFSAIMGAVNCGHNVPLINQKLIKQINTIWTTNFIPTDIQLEAISKINSVLPQDIECSSALQYRGRSNRIGSSACKRGDRAETYPIIQRSFSRKNSWHYVSCSAFS